MRSVSVILVLCCLSVASVWAYAKPSAPKAIDYTHPLTKIAFGSCNQELLDQSIWTSIVGYQPDIWIWLGDVVYADTRLLPFIWVATPGEEIKAKYARQKTNHAYAQLRQITPIVGVWDDHDYGKNDGGVEYHDKETTREIFLDFVDEPADSPRRTQEGGIYTSYTIGPENQRVKVILLDVRFSKEGVLGSGDILGEAQWKWLEDQLTNSDAQIHLIGSGIQILPQKIVQEKWAGFPESRRRLIKLIEKTKANGVFFLSGDVHYAEFMRMEPSCSGVSYPIHEVTSSGLTHTCDGNFPGFCKRILDRLLNTTYHFSEFYTAKNFGSIEIDWAHKPSPQVKLQIRALLGDVVREHTVALAEVSVGTADPSSRPIQECDLEVTNPSLVYLIPFEWWKFLIYGIIVVVLLVGLLVLRSVLRCLGVIGNTKASTAKANGKQKQQ